MKDTIKMVKAVDITLTEEDATWLMNFCLTGNLGSGESKIRRLAFVDTLTDILVEKESK